MKDKNNLRPKFHITADKGWINDPNGLVYFNGEYHVFYQHYPKDVQWGPMHWGHVVSKDLLNWKRLPIALYPGDEYDKNGCFSGSAIVWKDKLYLIYTGFIENGGGENIRQIQCLASSTDGVNFTKHGKIIDETLLPNGYNPSDFRDPKVWQENDTFYMIVAGKKINGKGRVLEFKSKDLFNWEFVGDLFNEDCDGEMVECPDYIKDLGLLLTSEQFPRRLKELHLNIHTTRWHKGEFDVENGTFKEETRGIVDYGFDFYAAQTFLKEPIAIGWLQMWDRNIPYKKHGFAGMLSIPRKLSVKDGELYQQPVIAENTQIKKTVKETLQDLAETGIIKINLESVEDFELKLRKKGDQYTLLKLENGKWLFDRSKSGESIEGAEQDELSKKGIRVMPKSNLKENNITIVMDLFSVEIFIDGKAMSSVICPEENSAGIELIVKAKNCQYERASIDASVDFE